MGLQNEAMHANHLVTAYPDRDLLHIKLSGFFGPADVAEFNRARLAAHARLTCGANRHVTLVDIRDMKLQAQDIFATFRRLIAEPGTRARRLALVTGCSAIRMQARRLLNGDDIACFTDTAEAEAWLMAPPVAQRLAG